MVLQGVAAQASMCSVNDLSLSFLLLSQNPIFVPPLETVEETTAMQVSCDAPITVMIELGYILVTSFVSTVPQFFLSASTTVWTLASMWNMISRRLLWR